ncbi:MAG: molybdopterin-binding protein [Gammaproteobacteria bacterium]|nr:molybdopterin-binding protein [Gammaproteobacteria bacterium]
MLVIGDEVLSGRRQDRHLPAVIERLGARGLRLSWARLVGDDMQLLVQNLREAQAAAEAVFCFGGIGATPDDLTREAAARAFDRPLLRHPEAETLIVGQFGAEAFPHRVRMADLPKGAELIPNPYNNVPGFSVGGMHFMPGFPQMAHAMLDWVLAQHYAHVGDAEYAEQALWVWDATESQLLDLMRELTARYPTLKLFSLPVLPTEHQPRRRIELGLKGAREVVETAMADLAAGIQALGFSWTGGT